MSEQPSKRLKAGFDGDEYEQKIAVWDRAAVDLSATLQAACTQPPQWQ